MDLAGENIFRFWQILLLFISKLLEKRFLLKCVLSDVISVKMGAGKEVQITKCPFDNLFAKKVLVSYNK
jgi:hypothetical protein